MGKLRITLIKKNNFLKYIKKKKASGFCNSTHAVSETIGVILILALVVTMMSAVYIIVFNPLSNPVIRAPAVDLVGTVNEEGTVIFFEHRGGPPLSKDVKIILSWAGENYEITAADLGVTDTWEFGTQLRITTINGVPINVYSTLVTARILDPKSNTFLLDTIIQHGIFSLYPTVKLGSDVIAGNNQATFTMQYDKRQYTGDLYLNFSYRKWTSEGTEVWLYTSNVLVVNPSGTLTVTVTGLEALTLYEFQANANYFVGDPPDPRTSKSQIGQFRTGGTVIGFWRFNIVGFDPKVAFDSSTYKNHGVIAGGETYVEGLPVSAGGLGGALLFDGVDDSVSVPDAPSIHYPEDLLTIEAWVQTKVDPTYGDVTLGGVVDDTSYPIGDAWQYRKDHSDFIHVYGEYYALVSNGANNRGYLMTVQITSKGEILSKNSLVDSWQFYNSAFYAPRIIHVYNNTAENYQVFAVVFSNSAAPDQGRVLTVAINNDGTIKKAGFTLSPLVLEASAPFRGVDIIKVGESIDHSIFAVVYGSDINIGVLGGKIRSIMIANSGAVTDVAGSTTFFDIDGEHYPEGFDLVHVHGTTYALFYSDTESNDQPDGAIRTFDITSTGQITNKQGNLGFFVEYFDANSAFHPHVIRYYDDGVSICKFAVVYQQYTKATANYMRLILITNISISYSGAIDKSKAQVEILFINTPSVGAGHRTYAKIIRISDDAGVATNNYAIMFSPDGTRGYITTVSIAPVTGLITVISENRVFSYLFSQSNIVQMRDSLPGFDLIAVAYEGEGGFAVIKTLPLPHNGVIPDDYIDHRNMTTVSTQQIGRLSWYDPDMIHLTGDIYAVVYRNIDRDAHLKTLRIDSNGIIQNQEIQSIRFDFYCIEPKLFKIRQTGENTWVGVVYRGNQSNLAFASFKINNNGALIEQVALMRDLPEQIWRAEVTHVRSLPGKEMYLLLLSGRTVSAANDRGVLYTLNVTVDGTGFTLFERTVVSALQFCTGSMTHVRGSVYALAYSNKAAGTNRYPGYLRTVNVSANGRKTLSPVSEFTDAATAGNNRGAYNVNIISLGSSHVAITYSSLTPYSIIVRTLRILDNDNVQPSILDSYQIMTAPTLNANYISDISAQLIHLRHDAYLIALRYRTSTHATSFDYHGYLQIVRINSTNAHISNAPISGSQSTTSGQVLFTSSIAKQFTVLALNSPTTRIAFAYQGDNYYEAHVKTWQINYNTDPQKTLLSKATGTNIRYGLLINATHVTGVINNQRVDTTLSIADTEWNYIVLTYDKNLPADNIKLYKNGKLESQRTYSITIAKQASDRITFGYFPMTLDEIKIQLEVMTPDQIKANWEEYKPV